MNAHRKKIGYYCLTLLMSLNLASQAHAFGWSMSCTMDKTKASYNQAISAKGQINSQLEECIADQAKAEANPNSTGTFLNLCEEKAPAEGSSLEGLCQRASNYKLKGNFLSSATKTASTIAKKVTPQGWDLDCNAQATSNSYDQANSNPQGPLPKQINECIADQAKAEANPNSTNAFLQKCQTEPSQNPRIDNLCKLALNYNLQTSIASMATGAASAYAKNNPNSALARVGNQAQSAYNSPIVQNAKNYIEK